MTSPIPLKVFVLGSFRDVRPSRGRSLGVLQRLVGFLRAEGWDAFLSGDARSVELAGAPLEPRLMTEVLEARCDLALFVGVKAGRGDGWVSELTALQIQNPEGATKRVLLLEAGYPLSALLDPLQQGYLADPPVIIGTWIGEHELRVLANRCAAHAARHGHLPPVL